ncbi:hypothetical protein [Alkalibacillus silvisoli]|uniref:Uncharacterized protein n=1 Tax=Alkalibacillus silvisoli TaxID=392823 RepID=A0ABN0ZQ84_9BACI
MIKNIRRKVANAISPEKSHSYPFVELNWATPESENKRSLERAHKKFKLEHGRPAIDDAEAWKWDREQLNVSLKELGLELASTEFIPEHFIEKENTPNSKNQG